MRKTSHLWNYLLVGVLLYLLYQSTFTWQTIEKNQEIKGNEVVFLTVEEKKYGIHKTSFDSLTESLKVWEFDEKNKQVYLKFDSLLPKNPDGKDDETKVMVMYDRGFDGTERHAEVLKVSTFPYKYELKEAEQLTVEGINKDGSVYLRYKGKKVKLEKDKSYFSYSFSGFQFTKTTIENHGIYQKEQFKKLEKPKKKSK